LQNAEKSSEPAYRKVFAVDQENPKQAFRAGIETQPAHHGSSGEIKEGNKYRQRELILGDANNKRYIAGAAIAVVD